MNRLLSVTGPLAVVFAGVTADEDDDELEPHAARYNAALVPAPAVMNRRRV
jgi:hypothetical protein